jgi:hypothetical protein
MRARLLTLLALLAACDASSAGTDVAVHNGRTTASTVYVAFGADSAVTAADWTFCAGSGLVCSFALGAGKTTALPNPSHAYLNATFSFDAPVGCGVTKAELNVNNPAWYDTLDVSLVDGFSDKVQITAVAGGTTTVLGPPVGASGNEKVLGVFPLGCDVCVARKDPPCGLTPGKSGCKAGTQYDPDVPCQWQGPTKGGGGTATLELLP